MRLTKFANIIVIGLTMATAMGCRKGTTPLTRIPGDNHSTPGLGDGSDKGQALAGDADKADSMKATDGGIPPADPSSFDGMVPHPEILAGNTVHFAYDSAQVKQSEDEKIQAVVDYLKTHSDDKIEIDGHADERGTAEYNRALGDRRAVALREQLAKAGDYANRVKTVSFGFDRPADSGHDSTAWAKNRRGEFVVLTPPGK